MLSYFIRVLAGSVIGYVFGLSSGLVIWIATIDRTALHSSDGIINFLFVMAFQSAILGGLAGLASARARGWAIVCRTVPAASLGGLFVILLTVAYMGAHLGAQSHYTIATQSARDVASINLVWGALVGLVVGLVFLPFYRITQSPSSTSPDQDG